MGHIEISSNDDRFVWVLLFEGFQVFSKCDVVTLSVLKPFEFFAGSRGVDVEEDKFLKLQSEDPSFLTVLHLGHVFDGFDRYEL